MSYTDDKAKRVELAKELFIASLIKEDVELRADAHCLDCLEELIEWRDAALEFTRNKALP